MTATLRRSGGTDYTLNTTLVDNLLPMLGRAAAVADLIRAAEDADAILCDSTIPNACGAIMAEMDDAREVLNEWHAAQREGDSDNLKRIREGIAAVVGSEEEADKLIAAVDRALWDRKFKGVVRG